MIYKGLSADEVRESRERYGSNVLTPPKGISPWREFFQKFSDPLIIILLVAGVLSVGIAFYEHFGLGKDWKVFFEPIGIFVAIALATGLAYLFESKANRAFRILNQVNDDETVEVIRDGVTTTVTRRGIVVGDIVIINTGDEIPADGELLESIGLSVDESTLTGEPICKKATDNSLSDPESTYPANRVYRGTKVMEGHAIMRVLKVGDATEMGKVYEESHIDNSIKTPLNEQLDRLAKLISYGSYVIAGLIIVIRIIGFLGWQHWEAWVPALPVGIFFWLVMRKFQGWSKTKCGVCISLFFVIFIGIVAGAFSLIYQGGNGGEWSELLAYALNTVMVAVTLIVVAVPEGLPMAITLSLAYSMSRMLKSNNLVRKMHACETMGATTVICTDKTGTLTQNRMQVSEMKLYGNDSENLIKECIAVNSTAQLDLTGDTPAVLGNPTEGALLLWLRDKGCDYVTLRADTKVVNEIPFSTEIKYMATETERDGCRMLYMKGAPEIVYAMCCHSGKGATAGISSKELNEILAGYQNRAMRTLGFAAVELKEGETGIKDGKIDVENLSSPLSLIGITAISDPVREDVPGAVKEVLDAGIKIKIVTGDTPGTAKEIARQIGLWDDNRDGERNIITGAEFMELSDEVIHRRAGELKIIARARPMDKKRLVEALQAGGEVVAVTGDGTNDAPALKTAHVGLSMGDGTSVAKEASDITIIDNSFSSIGRAVMWGRSLYKNIQRFLLFQLTVNVSACLLVLFGSFIGTESPLSVTQMLWVNLIMDTFGAMALASLPPSESVMKEKPRSRKASILTRPMIEEISGVGILFFAITFGFFWLFNHADISSMLQVPHILTNLARGDSMHLSVAQGMTLVEATLLFSIFVWTHFWYMFDARSFDTGRSIFRLRMSQGFWTIVVIIVIGQLFITEVGYEFFNVTPMLYTPGGGFNSTGVQDLLIIVSASSLVLLLRELYRLLRPRSQN